MEVVEDLSPIKCSIAQCLLDLPAREVLFRLVNERIELAPVRYSLISDLDYSYLFGFHIHRQMNLDPASMDSPLFSHRFATVGYLDPREVYSYHNRLFAGQYRVWKAELQLSAASPDMGMVCRHDFGNQLLKLSHCRLGRWKIT
jgi:hypothetical protein